MARGWYGNKEAHSRAAKKGWITRRAEQGMKKEKHLLPEMADSRYYSYRDAAREYAAGEAARKRMGTKPQGQKRTEVEILRQQIKGTEESIAQLKKYRGSTAAKKLIHLKEAQLKTAREQLKRLEA